MQEAEITLHSIAITESADSKLDLLATSTGGLSFLYSGSSTSNAINEAFLKIGNLNSGDYKENLLFLLLLLKVLSLLFALWKCGKTAII